MALIEVGKPAVLKELNDDGGKLKYKTHTMMASPDAEGTSGQVLKTDGEGSVYWGNEGGGSSGSGFDFVGKIDYEVTVVNGELVTLEPLSTPIEETSFSAAFGDVADPDTDNVYERVVRLTEGIPVPIIIYGFYDSGQSQWATKKDPRQIGEKVAVVYSCNLIQKPLNFIATSQAIQTRPLTASIIMPAFGEAAATPTYGSLVYDYSALSSQFIMASLQVASILLRPVASGEVGTYIYDSGDNMWRPIQEGEIGTHVMRDSFLLLLYNVLTDLTGVLILTEEGTSSQSILGVSYVDIPG